MSRYRYALARLKEFGVGKKIQEWANVNPGKTRVGIGLAVGLPGLYVAHKYKQRKRAERFNQWKRSGLLDAVNSQMGRQVMAENLRAQGHSVTLR